ncbi:MAG: glycosyltransferase [Lachnospiraceae bacterium]|nr:glycosyltransferase [Lachnospiraceae bacterium]
MIRKVKEKNSNKVSGPLLSVVIPLYNHEKFIAEAIESVLNQTYISLELIIIDDGSKDKSVQIAKKYLNDERVQLIEQENAGAHMAINRGLEMAKGDYLAILNSDDVYEDNRFEKMITYMEAHKEVGFLCSYITVIDDKGKELGVKEGWRNMEPWQIPHPELSFKATDDFKKNLLMTNFTSTTSNFLFTRELYQKIGGMRNLRFAHDWDFALRAAEVTQCKIIEEPLMKYRIHSSNTISSNRKWMMFEIVWMWASNLRRFYGKELFSGENLGEEMVQVVESLNLQGNDKVFWMIMMYMDVRFAKEISNPEEELLENESLREYFINYIVE